MHNMVSGTQRIKYILIVCFRKTGSLRIAFHLTSYKIITQKGLLCQYLQQFLLFWFSFAGVNRYCFLNTGRITRRNTFLMESLRAIKLLCECKCLQPTLQPLKKKAKGNCDATQLRQLLLVPRYLFLNWVVLLNRASQINTNTRYTNTDSKFTFTYIIIINI